MTDAPSPSSLRLASATLGMESDRLRFEVLHGGRNSRVFRVFPGGGTPVVLKEYAPDFAIRQTLSRESESFRLLHLHGIHSVPQVLTVDEVHGIALYSDLGGRSIQPDKLGEEAFAPFLDLLKSLKAIRVEDFPRWAADASIHASSLAQQIRSRVESLPADRAELSSFLEDSLLPYFRVQRETALTGTGTEPLPVPLRILSPSDFGFHNAVLREDGSFGFVDFEFFGQDDPVKLLSDLLLHPAMESTPAQKRHLVDGFLALQGDDPTFQERFEALFPLVGIKWCCILLNEFTPAGRSRRNFAGVSREEEEQILRRQLCKARNLLDNLRQRQCLSRTETEVPS